MARPPTTADRPSDALEARAQEVVRHLRRDPAGWSARDRAVLAHRVAVLLPKSKRVDPQPIPLHGSA